MIITLTSVVVQGRFEENLRTATILHLMSIAIVLQHVPHEGPGRLVDVFRDYGIPMEVRHLYKGDEVPTDLDELRVLDVLGGPMGAADVGGSRFQFLEKVVAE